jgi:hypothetical protein
VAAGNRTDRVSAEGASDNLLRRMTLMARFIGERHMEEFSEYWAQNWPGKATASDFIEYMKRSDIHEKFVLRRKVSGS